MATLDTTTEIILNVTTTIDENDGSPNVGQGLSLRDALLRTNIDPTKNYTINLPAGIYNLTQQNSTSVDQTDATLAETRLKTGDLDVRGSVTIIGQDPANTIISAEGLKKTFSGFGNIYIADNNNSDEIQQSIFPTSLRNWTVGDRVFDVQAGAILNLNNVTIKDGLIIREKTIFVDENENDIFDIRFGFDDEGNTFFNGSDIDRPINIGNVDTVIQGGAINIAANATVILKNTIVANNQVEGPGGSIYNNGTLEINDSQIQENNTILVGDLSVGQLVGVGGDFLDNSFSPLTPVIGEGAGIYNNGTMTVNRSSIINNAVDVTQYAELDTDQGKGAGILNNGDLTVTNSTISGNKTDYFSGGGILNRNDANLINTTITNNTSTIGTGIRSENPDFDVVLSNSIVVDNLGVKINEKNQQPILLFDDRNDNFFDKQGQSLFNSADDINLDFYNGDVYYRSEDPFSKFSTTQLVSTNVRDIVFDFDNNANITFIFDQDNNLVSNPDQNFVFSYQNESFETVILDIELDENGNLILVDNTFNDSETIPTISLEDKSNEFLISSNTIFISDSQKDQATYVFDENGEQITRQDVVSFDIEKNSTPELDGFFSSSSSFNLIGSSSSVNILDSFNSNIVGSLLDPIDAQLEPVLDNNNDTIAYNLKKTSPAIDKGDNKFGLTKEEEIIPDQLGNPRISNKIIDIGSTEFQVDGNGSGGNGSGVGGSGGNENPVLNTPIFRFQNTEVPGTYLYTGESESLAISSNFPNFKQEGFAFYVGIAPEDDLIPMYRFQNSDSPGTYLYVGDQERLSILENNHNFVQEGVAFYVYGAGSDLGQDIYRFQNSDLPGTYLFVGAQERQSIINNNPNFVEEGIAFEVTI